ncbi:MAG: phosphate ABC transporter ATP-binding protein, partial [Methanobacterium aggregans]
MDYRIEVEDLNVYFDESHILKDVNLKIRKNRVTS